MKYKLLKKWHPSQVEEVGHVFEESDIGEFSYYIRDGKTDFGNDIFPHEIALLVHAGYLGEQCGCGQYMSKHTNASNGYCTGKNKGNFFGCPGGAGNPMADWKEMEETKSDLKPPLDIWTEEPPVGQQYWIHFWNDENQEFEIRYLIWGDNSVLDTYLLPKQIS